MKKLILLASVLVLGACAHDPNRVTNVDTHIDKSDVVTGNQQVGVKDGRMITQKKELLSESLRNLQYQVYDLEADLYGGPRYHDNRGLWGVLFDCSLRLASVSNGGEGKLPFTEPRDYVVPDDDSVQVGLDENGKLVTLTEEGVKDRIVRFEIYKQTLQKRQTDYEMKIKSCELAVEARKVDRSTASTTGH